MTKTEVDQLRQKLLDLRDGLLELEASSQERTMPVELDQAVMGRLSRMDAIQAMRTAGEGARQRARQVQKIEGALRRISLGEYGTCFICEEELDLPMLSADPTITRCMNCVEQ
ncbi:MAG: TraR/DksA family transcriptional regulator [Nitrospirota bacterium]